MKTRNPQAQIAFALGTLLLTTPPMFAAPGGPIDPPGPPGVIYKTLDEVEPRTPISAVPYTINRPGSYYVTTNLVASAGQNGITITASDVTLDLRGFALIGVAGSIDGVNVSVSVTNLAVLNGTATGWGQMGFDADTAYNSQLIDLRASRNGTRGLSLGQGGIIRNCVARTNRTDGINANVVCTINGCTSVGNGDDGIAVGTGSTVTGCSVSGNADDGIEAGDGSIVSGNAASGNTGDGIQVANGCQVVNNNCDGNGAGAAIGAGILATGTDNNIEANNLTGADRGLDIQGTGNVIANNTVRRNAANYNIVQGNQLNLLLGQIPQTINWPCNVVLAGALTGTAANNGITIAANDVTIDLGGHVLIGVAGALDGILVSGTRTNIAVRNGSVQDWPGDGVDATSAVNSQLQSVGSSRNTGNGLLVGEGSVVSGCTVRANLLDGIRTGGGCRITDCSASRNGGDGIETGTGSSLTGCAAFDNSRQGINGSTACTVTGCSAYSNTGFGIEAANSSSILQCSVYANSTNGISVTFGSRVSGCTVRLNSGHGIAVNSDCQAENNNCAVNTLAGVFVMGTRSRIDGNNIAGGQRGIQVTGNGNLIVRNSVAGATVADYDIVAGNSNAQVLAPGANFVASNPWANFSY